MKPNKPIRPLMTIGTLLTAGSLIVLTLASGLMLTLGSLPAEAVTFAERLALVGPIGAAVAMGMGAIGKGLYEIGKRGVNPEEELDGLPPTSQG